MLMWCAALRTELSLPGRQRQWAFRPRPVIAERETVGIPLL